MRLAQQPTLQQQFQQFLQQNSKQTIFIYVAGSVLIVFGAIMIILLAIHMWQDSSNASAMGDGLTKLAAHEQAALKEIKTALGMQQQQKQQQQQHGLPNGQSKTGDASLPSTGKAPPRPGTPA